ncbi:hypothetical protein HanPSC8_Chr17g0748141 [Helianthus annuus]|nr:hypothetical protein HanPSC8_Chr17g0748141 [Helianthus annuus]
MCYSVSIYTSKLVDGTSDYPLASGATHPDLKLNKVVGPLA